MFQHGYEPEPGETLHDVCAKYGISYGLLTTRLKRGFSWEDATTRKVLESYSQRTAREPIDHLGNEYESLNEMCAAWSVSRTLFNDRMQIGWTLKDALETPLLVSAGEKVISEILEKKGIAYVHSHSIRQLFTRCGMRAQFNEFLGNYVAALKEIGINVNPSKIARMQFNFTLLEEGRIFAFVEYDDVQNFKYLQIFHETFKGFMAKHNKDKVKTMFAEMSNIPLLRIRKEQLDKAEQMIDDLLQHPDKYLGKHNTYLENSEYWDEDEKQLSSISELAIV